MIIGDENAKRDSNPQPSKYAGNYILYYTKQLILKSLNQN
jgi:hypothetical protein